MLYSSRQGGIGDTPRDVDNAADFIVAGSASSAMPPRRIVVMVGSVPLVSSVPTAAPFVDWLKLFACHATVSCVRVPLTITPVTVACATPPSVTTELRHDGRTLPGVYARWQCRHPNCTGITEREPGAKIGSQSTYSVPAVAL